MKYIIVLLAAFAVGCAQPTKKEQDYDKKKTEKVEASKDKKAGKPKAERKAAKGDVTCKIGGEVRTLKVVNKDDGKAVEYTRDGSTNEIATCNLSGEFCMNIVNRVKNNLEEAGWSCS